MCVCVCRGVMLCVQEGELVGGRGGGECLDTVFFQ